MWGYRGTAKYGGGDGAGGRARAGGSSGPTGATKFAQYALSPTQPATKFAQCNRSIGVSAKKFARQAIKRHFWGIFRGLGELFHAHTHDRAVLGELLHTQDATRGDFATNDTTAATDAGQHETAVTNALP